MQKVLLVVALLLAGCASDAPADDEGTSGAKTTSGAPFQARQLPMQFAVGAYEGNMTGEATYSIAEQCAFDCGGNAKKIFDLSNIIPADAPVELTITVNGARADLEFVDASARGGQPEFTGVATLFAAIVVRSASGSVFLHVYNPGGFSIPPEANPTASFQAHTVIRPDVIIPFIPASVTLQPGDVLNVTGNDIHEVLLFDPQGRLTRDQSAPFELTINGTSGTYLVLVAGGETARIFGPNRTLEAKRLSFTSSNVYPLASGAATTWSFTTDSRPVAVGLHIGSISTVEFLGAGTVMTQYDASIVGPGNVGVIAVSETCQPICGLVFIGYSASYSTEFFDERLVPGQYDVSVSYTGNGMQASSWALVIA